MQVKRHKQETKQMKLSNSHIVFYLTNDQGNNYTNQSSSCKVWIKCKICTLYTSDQMVLLSSSEWLNDNIISAAQNMLKDLNILLLVTYVLMTFKLNHFYKYYIMVNVIGWSSVLLKLKVIKFMFMTVNLLMLHMN